MRPIALAEMDLEVVAAASPVDARGGGEKEWAAAQDWVQIEILRQRERERRQRMWEEEDRIEREEEEVETALRAGHLVGPSPVFVQDLELYSF